MGYEYTTALTEFAGKAVQSTTAAISQSGILAGWSPGAGQLLDRNIYRASALKFATEAYQELLILKTEIDFILENLQNFSEYGIDGNPNFSIIEPKLIDFYHRIYKKNI